VHFPGGGGGPVRPNISKNSMKLNWNFQRVGVGKGGRFRKNPFRGGDMDVFWNYTLTG